MPNIYADMFVPKMWREVHYGVLLFCHTKIIVKQGSYNDDRWVEVTENGNYNKFRKSFDGVQILLL